METLRKNWPSIKTIIYYLLAAGLAFASTKGWVTAEQATSFTDYALTALTTIGSLFFVVAGKNVNKPALEPIPVPDVSNTVEEIRSRVQSEAQDAVANATAVVRKSAADARAELERAFGTVVQR